MSMLSSVFKGNKDRRKGGGGGGGKGIQKRFIDIAHIRGTRTQQPPSPSESFASPGINEQPFNAASLYDNSQVSVVAPFLFQGQPNGNPNSSSGSVNMSASASGSTGPKKATNASSPRIQMEFGLEESTFSDWLQPDMLRTVSESVLPTRNVSLGASSLLGASSPPPGRSRSGTNASVATVLTGSGVAGPSTSTSKLSAVAETRRDDRHRYGSGGFDDVIVIEAPRGRDPAMSPLRSDFVHNHSATEPVAETHPEPRETPPRRRAPSPIKIPRRTSGQVHLQRSASLSSLIPPQYISPSKPPSSFPGRQHSDPASLFPSRAPSRVRTRSFRSHSQSRPASMYSHYSDTDLDFDDSVSAVSGTTLARALLSSFILSTSPSTSQRRSKGHLARQDSATLPRGDYPYFNQGKNVRSSRGSQNSNLAWGSGETYWKDHEAPPVPPMPEGLSPAFPLSPPLVQSNTGGPTFSGPRSRHGSATGQATRDSGTLGVESLTGRRGSAVSDASRHSSRRSSSGGDVTASGRRLTVDPEIKRRRISRISEASGSASAGASARSPGSATALGRSNSQVSLPFAGGGSVKAVGGGDTLEEEKVGEGEECESQPRLEVADTHEQDHGQEIIISHSPPPKSQLSSPDAPTTATSISMSIYSDSSHSSGNNHSQHVFSPGSSSSGSIYPSSSNSMTNFSAGLTSNMSFSPSSLGFKSPGTSSSLGVGSRNSIAPSVSEIRSMSGSPRPVVTLLPIGERPRSAQVPHSPSPQSSRGSHEARPYSTALTNLSPLPHPRMPTSARDSLDSPDLLDNVTFAPHGPSIPITSSGSVMNTGSSRVGSPPAPISVPPHSNASSGGFELLQGDSDAPPTASGVQTFPETPYAFTPASAAFSSPALPPTMRDVPPALPRTGTVAVRGLAARTRMVTRDAHMRSTSLTTTPSLGGKQNIVMPMTPPPSGRQAALAKDASHLGVAIAEGQTNDTQKNTLLSAIEEKSAPSTPQTNPSSLGPTPEPSPSPPRKRPSSIKVDHADSDVQDSKRVSQSDRPSSLVPAKRPLTPLLSPPESTLSTPPSPSVKRRMSVSVSELNSSPGSIAYALPEQSGSGFLATPPPTVSIKRVSQAPSLSSESSSSLFFPGGTTAATTPESTPNKRLQRIRPPPPSGPRKPSNSGSGPFLRARNGSVSSQASTVVGSTASRYPSVSLSASSPRFQTTPIKFRGLTMEAAQWTFTSQQLQTIVSTAIKKSAVASSIRLLPLEMLNESLPAEIQRLEVLSSELRTNYKLGVRKRKMLLNSLSYSTETGESAASGRLLEEISELSENMDHFSEELYSVTDQLTQLNRLRDLHSSSALAMALRKLNNSFIKTIADNQALHARVATLEEEREEAWKHAHDAALEVDDLNEKLSTSTLDRTSVPTPASSRRSSRVIIARKASVRVSKAGLRSPSRLRSQRSSVASSMGASMSPAWSSSSEHIPPVPRIPHAPLGISTSGLPGHNSAMTSDSTPTSDVRAMAQAQYELCEMLGISPEELRAPIDIRPRSMATTLHSAGLSEPSPRSARMQRSRRNSDTSTPSSRGSEAWMYRYRSRSIDDRSVMLATIGMTSP